MAQQSVEPQIADLAHGWLKQYKLEYHIEQDAPNDEIRNKLMPISKAYPMDKLMEAVKYYEKTAGRRVTFEYIMLDGVNDKDSDAEELCRLLKGLNCYINLIPYNETNNIEYKRSKN